jgi:hypothetical protein
MLRVARYCVQSTTAPTAAATTRISRGTPDHLDDLGEAVMGE